MVTIGDMFLVALLCSVLVLLLKLAADLKTMFTDL